jgi:hypothetical protein
VSELKITDKAYQNAYTKKALKTLRQFLKNMLAPIWIRDVPYNLKGKLSYKDACNLNRYNNNIKIEKLNS